MKHRTTLWGVFIFKLRHLDRLYPSVFDPHLIDAQNAVVGILILIKAAMICNIMLTAKEERAVMPCAAGDLGIFKPFEPLRTLPTNVGYQHRWRMGYTRIFPDHLLQAQGRSRELS